MAGELILIIEDDEKNLKLVRDILRAKGYRTIEAGSAEAGLNMLADSKPDLVLMDIRLPGISGIDALKKLRTLRSGQRIPVVAFTASVMAQEVLAAFDGIALKPIVSLKDFVGSIRKALDSPRSAP